MYHAEFYILSADRMKSSKNSLSDFTKFAKYKIFDFHKIIINDAS